MIALRDFMLGLNQAWTRRSSGCNDVRAMPRRLKLPCDGALDERLRPRGDVLDGELAALGLGAVNDDLQRQSLQGLEIVGEAGVDDHRRFDAALHQQRVNFLA